LTTSSAAQEELFAVWFFCGSSDVVDLIVFLFAIASTAAPREISTRTHPHLHAPISSLLPLITPAAKKFTEDHSSADPQAAAQQQAAAHQQLSSTASISWAIAACAATR